MRVFACAVCLRVCLRACVRACVCGVCMRVCVRRVRKRDEPTSACGDCPLAPAVCSSREQHGASPLPPPCSVVELRSQTVLARSKCSSQVPVMAHSMGVAPP